VRIEVFSAPPGWGKTYSIAERVARGEPLLVALPTLRSVAYAFDIVASRGPPRRHVVEYVGVANYCLLYDPNALLALLDYDVSAWRLLKAHGGGEGFDAFWSRMERLLAEYLSTGDVERYRRGVARLVEEFGRSRVCRRFCPAGLALRLHRSRVEELLSTPRLVSWRRTRFVHVVSANPAMAARSAHVEALTLELALCPRLLVSTPLVPRAAGRAWLVSVGAVLTTHAALPYIMRILSRIRVEKRIVIDEFDAFLRPACAPIVSRSLIDCELGVLDELSEGGEYAAHAVWASSLLYEAAELVDRAVSGREYHPVAALVAEAAVEPLAETTLKARVVYPPLSPRPVHVKHFQGTRLLQALRLEADEWRGFARELSALVATRCRVRVLAPVRGRRGYVIRGATVGAPRPFTEMLRWLVAPLAHTPVYTLHYRVGAAVSACRVEDRLAWLASMSHSLELLTATPVNWSLLARGPAQPVPGEGVYESMARGARLAVASFTGPVARVHAGGRVYEWSGRIRVYTDAGRRAVERAASSILELPDGYQEAAEAVVETRLPEGIDEYKRLARLIVVPSLPPIPPWSDGSAERLYASLAARLASEAPVLVLAQSRRVAARIASMLGAVLNEGRPAYYRRGGIVVTWFRSRLGRGVDIDVAPAYVVVAGSPLPPPTVLTPTPSQEALSVPVVVEYRRRWRLWASYAPRDREAAMAEFYQAVGRALRAARKTGARVTVVVSPHVYRLMLRHRVPWL
jgi:hypothetical protein